MLEKLITNPTVVTIIAFLVIAITAFVKGTVRSGLACDATLLEIKKLYEARITDLDDRVQMANRRADQWMEIAMRATGAAADLINVAKSRDVRDNRDSEERENRR